MRKIVMAVVFLFSLTGFAAPTVEVLTRQFNEMDTDKDGKATRQELDAWFKERAEKTKKPFNPGSSKVYLNKHDADKDGALTLEEWLSKRE